MIFDGFEETGLNRDMLEAFAAGWAAFPPDDGADPQEELDAFAERLGGRRIQEGTLRRMAKNPVFWRDLDLVAACAEGLDGMACFEAMPEGLREAYLAGRLDIGWKGLLALSGFAVSPERAAAAGIVGPEALDGMVSLARCGVRLSRIFDGIEDGYTDPEAFAGFCAEGLNQSGLSSCKDRPDAVYGLFRNYRDGLLKKEMEGA